MFPLQAQVLQLLGACLCLSIMPMYGNWYQWVIGDWYCSGVYTEAILQDVLEYRGLEDLEIELDLLLDKNQDMFLEQVLRVLKLKVPEKDQLHTNSCQMLLILWLAVHANTRLRMQWRAYHRKLEIPIHTLENKGHSWIAPTWVSSKNAMLGLPAITVAETIILKVSVGAKSRQH